MKRLSSDTKAYASLALFRKMRDKDVDILDIVESLAANVVLDNGKATFSKEELYSWIYEKYGFEIPDGAFDLIVKRNNNFQIASKKPFLLSLKSGVTQSAVVTINNQYSDLYQSYNNIEENLYDFINSQTGSTLDDENKVKVREALHNHLLEKGSQNEYTPMILKYILTNETEPGFKGALDSLLEGLLIYIGLNTEPKDKNINAFTSPLVLILDTEILFHLSGYHGETFKRRIVQFIDYVEEVNRDTYKLASKRNEKGGRIITFRYLPSTQSEINHIFNTAEDAKRNYGYPLNYTVVVNHLIHDFDSPSAIAEEKSEFWNHIHKLGIREVADVSRSQRDEYQVIKGEDYKLDEGDDKEEGKYNDYEQGKIVSKEESSHNLVEASDFERVNDNKLNSVYYHLIRLNDVFALRGGNVNDKRLEKARYILVTDTIPVLKKSRDLFKEGIVKNSYNLAVSLTDISVSFWLKLNKSLAPNEIPLSYDLLAKTRCALANIAGDQLRKEFQNIQKQVKEGTLTEEKAVERIAAVRSSKIKADDYQNADDVDPFLHGSLVDNWLQMNEMQFQSLNSQLEEKEKIIKAKEEANAILVARDKDYRRKEAKRERDKKFDLFQNVHTNWKNHRDSYLRGCMKKEWRYTIVWLFCLSVLIISTIVAVDGDSTVRIVSSFIIVPSLIKLVLALIKHKRFMRSLGFLFCPDKRSATMLNYGKEYDEVNPEPIWEEPVFEE